MLSYRHAFHAGNHADVIKHSILARTLVYLTTKEHPFLYLDTHAGAGQYNLHQAMACKTNDKTTGITKLWNNQTTLPSLLQPYFTALHTYNPEKKLRLYPGSPLIAQQFLRSQDRAVCYELHPTDYTELNNILCQDQRFLSIHADGLQGLVSQLPPKERRGLILIDPSYEQTIDYKTIPIAIEKAIQRFPTGIYIIWYPLLHNTSSMPLIRSLIALSIPKFLHLEFNIATSHSQPGMLGCGLWIINPPWVLESELRTALPWLAHNLGTATATWRLN